MRPLIAAVRLLVLLGARTAVLIVALTLWLTRSSRRPPQPTDWLACTPRTPEQWRLAAELADVTGRPRLMREPPL